MIVSKENFKQTAIQIEYAAHSPYINIENTL